jgi:hypothetical protein
MNAAAQHIASSCHAGRNSAGASGKSANNVVRAGKSAFRPEREIENVEAIELIRSCIQARFSASSIDAMAKKAAPLLQTSPDTIRRIMQRHTTRFDGNVGLRAIAWGALKVKEPAMRRLLVKFAHAIIAEMESE